MYKISFYPIAFLILCLLSSCDNQGTEANIAPADWEVLSIKHSWHAIPDIAENAYVLKLKDGMRYSIDLDVNSCGGSFILPDAGEIEFSVPACTEACCDSEYAERLMQILREVSSYYLVGGKLILKGEGEITLKRL